MLLQLRDYIVRENVASIQQMAREFQIDATALQPMLDFWAQKGVISAVQNKTRCQSTCSKCYTSTVVFYVSQN